MAKKGAAAQLPAAKGGQANVPAAAGQASLPTTSLSNSVMELTDDEKLAYNDMSGLDRAVLLMYSLSEDDAAAIFRNLQPKQVQTLSMRMSELSNFTQSQVNAVHKMFLKDVTQQSNLGLETPDFVRRALVAALGEDKANNLVEQISLSSGSRGLDSLKWMDSRQVASIIQNEHPQIQTIVLSYLEPEKSAEILAQFPEPVRLDLIMRIATLEEVQPAALQELNEIMEKQFAGAAGAQTAKIGGLKSAADIMNFLDTATETKLMTSLQAQDKEMGLQIQDLMFVFENLVDVDDRSIQTLLRDVPSETLQKALKGADDTLKLKFFRNMSTRAVKALKEDLAAMGPTKISDVEAAQKEILNIAHKLADAGSIVLSRGGSANEFI